MTTTEATDLLEAIARCAKEPIHVPGSIQPHGFLLAVSEPELRVQQASENVRHWLGVEASALLDQPLSSLLPAAPLEAGLASLTEEDHNPFHLSDVSFALQGAGDQAFALMAHRHAGRLILEFERTGNSGQAYDTLYPLMRTFVARLQETGRIDDLCQLAVEEVKRITGFGRVKAYRFDAEDNGVVLAEIADPGYPSYQGLCFPAADIPPQARRLYRDNLIRVIQDADYRPSPLVPPLNPASGAPLDLSFAALRSVSPVHLQYMRNMGTRASMSISLVIQGRLWGLISCHDAEPRAVSYQTRTACELLGRILALQIEARESETLAQRKLELRRQIVHLLSAMADCDSVVEGFRQLPEVVLSFAEANGAAIISADRCETVGDTPDNEQISQLVRWLGERHAQMVFHSDCISRDIPELPGLAEHCAGVLAISISRLHAHYLIWFRREQIKTVDWAGQPQKHIDSQSGALSPRHSFERWREILRGYALPWDPVEIECALELRNAVLGIVLRKAEEMAQLTGELRASNKELESFSYSVSHDLRAPLRHIAGYTELLGEMEGSHLSERGMRFLENIADAARFAGTLVDNLLSFSQMGRAALRLSDVDLGALVASIREEIAPDCEGRQIEWHLLPMPIIVADASFIHMVLRNLIGNAVKYSRKREAAVIEVGAEQRVGEVVVYVRDNGVGFDMQYASKLFGVFQRLHRMEEFEGTGIGLASVRRIIERHDGQVWAEGELDKGATFYFSLPKLTYTQSLPDRGNRC
ncbi:ATP-binding protein [Stutzerimonas stutzeri]|uniref:histidine kinase n=1 Tax=Stutzerimonas stutzeri KOS6 TaxID=1218352 RepID=A0A061JUH9_STUST|nr:ATP-binding protein [Stutzerimonas stutzeri]EWC42303.1 ATPase [Stutzerimonas stutzeri KOS6]